MSFDLRCSTTAPYTIWQLGMASGKLLIHEVSVCSKIASLLPTEIKPIQNRITSVSWTLEGNLLVCDLLGNVWLIGSEGRRRSVIIPSDLMPAKGSGRKIPMLVATQGGILLVDINSQIRVSRYVSRISSLR